MNAQQMRMKNAVARVAKYSVFVLNFGIRIKLESAHL
jgi:hypothetical protein